MSYRTKKKQSVGSNVTRKEYNRSNETLPLIEDIEVHLPRERLDSVVFTEENEIGNSLGIEIEDIIVKDAFSTLSRAEKQRRKYFPGSRKMGETLGPLVTRIGEISSDRLKRREEEEISKQEKGIARKLQPLPSEIEIKTFEKLLFHLHSMLKQVEESESQNEAAKARASVYIGYVANQTANILHNAIDLHEHVLSKCDTPTQTRHLKRTRKWRMNGSFVQRMVEKAMKDFPEFSMKEKHGLFESIGYISIEQSEEHPLRCYVNLKKHFLEINKKVVSLSDLFYASGNKTIFQLRENVDKNFVCVSKQELELHISLMGRSLDRAGMIIQKLSNDAFNQLSFQEALDKLDEEKLNFLSPLVLPNIKFVDSRLHEGNTISLVGYLDYTEQKFSCLLTKNNLLTHLELQLLNKN